MAKITILLLSFRAGLNYVNIKVAIHFVGISLHVFGLFFTYFHPSDPNTLPSTPLLLFNKTYETQRNRVSWKDMLEKINALFHSKIYNNVIFHRQEYIK